MTKASHFLSLSLLIVKVRTSISILNDCMGMKRVGTWNLAQCLAYNKQLIHVCH